MKRISSYLLVVACPVLRGGVFGPDPELRGSGVTVFEGARLITGDGSAPIENSVFIVQNNLFTAVGRQGELQVPAGAARVNLTGKTVMPAKVDLHGHLGYEDVVAGTTSKANFTRQNLIEHLERFAYMGWSAVVSIADLEEREIFPGDHLDVYQSPRDPLLPKTGRMPWGHVPIADGDRSHSERGTVSHRRPGDGHAGWRSGRPRVQKRRHVSDHAHPKRREGPFRTTSRRNPSS